MYEDTIMEKAARPLLILGRVEKARSITSAIYDRVSDLERALEAVLEPDHPTPGGPNGHDLAAAPQAPLAAELDALTATLVRTEARLANIAARLQI